VLAQTFGDWQAIVVDDASTDGTAAVAASYAARDPRVRLIALERNVGVAAARNVAIEASAGDLVALLDHDDRWREDYLERCVAIHDAAAADGRKVGIVASNALIETPSGLSGETFADRYGWAEPIVYDAMIERNCICARALFARAAYDEVGGFSPEVPCFDDYDMWLRMLEAGYEVVATREPIAVYRVAPGQLSSDELKMAEGALAAHNRALERGAASPAQRSAIKARLRHYRALRERALARRASREGRRLAAAGRALRAAPFGAVAFLQAPSRWGEWLRDGRRARSTTPS
jgi:glycosyltransferase involved in cell wall biosynthesis